MEVSLEGINSIGINQARLSKRKKYTTKSTRTKAPTPKLINNSKTKCSTKSKRTGYNSTVAASSDNRNNSVRCQTFKISRTSIIIKASISNINKSTPAKNWMKNSFYTCSKSSQGTKLKTLLTSTKD